MKGALGNRPNQRPRAVRGEKLERHQKGPRIAAAARLAEEVGDIDLDRVAKKHHIAVEGPAVAELSGVAPMPLEGAPGGPSRAGIGARQTSRIFGGWRT